VSGGGGVILVRNYYEYACWMLVGSKRFDINDVFKIYASVKVRVRVRVAVAE
jgi:hypothetical protein